MAWSDAGQRPEAMPVACTGCDFAVSNRPAVSTPATATYRCRSQSITASGMIYDHVSSKSNLKIGPTERVLAGRQSITAPWCITAILATVALVGLSLVLLHYRLSVGKSLWVGGTIVLVAGLAVVTPAKLSWGLTICSLVGVGIVLRMIPPILLPIS